MKEDGKVKGDSWVKGAFVQVFVRVLQTLFGPQPAGKGSFRDLEFGKLAKAWILHKINCRPCQLPQV